MRAEQRYVWTLGAVNGLLVVAVVVFVYSLSSSWMFHPAMVVTGIPFGLLTMWRVSQYVRRLRKGTAKPFRGPLEGFILMFVVAAAYLTYNIFAAQAWNRRAGAGRSGASSFPTCCSTPCSRERRVR